MLKKTLLLLIILNSFSISSQKKISDFEKKYNDLLVKLESLGSKITEKFTKEKIYINERVVSLKEQNDILSKHKKNPQSSSYKNAEKQIGILIKEADSCFILLSEKFKKIQQVQKNRDDLLIDKIKTSQKKQIDSIKKDVSLKNKSHQLIKIEKDKALSKEVVELKKTIEDLNKKNTVLNKSLTRKDNELIKITDKIKYWVFAVTLLFFLIISILVWIFFKKRLAFNETIKEFQYVLEKKDESIENLESQVSQLSKNLISLKSTLQNSSVSNTKNIFSPLSKTPSNIKPSFLAESFVTAGPRKNYIEQIEDGDIDLGEDTAGFLINGDYAAFWVLDGTSGQDKLYSNKSNENDRILLGPSSKEYFSSRLLAQNIAWNLHSIIKSNGLEFSSFILLKQAIEETQKQWQRNIDNLKFDDKKELEQILVKRNMVMCSTTIAFGIITMNKELDLTISGDCVVITQPNPIEIPSNNRRQSANIYLKNGIIKVDFNNLKEENCVIKNAVGIDKVVAMSDGISKTTQKWITSNTNIDFTNPQIRESLARLQQKSMDDKSISIIQII